MTQEQNVETDADAIGLMLDREAAWVEFLDSEPAIKDQSQIDVDDGISPLKHLTSETAHASVIAAAGAMLGVNSLVLGMVTGRRPTAGNTLGPTIRAALLPATRALSILHPEERALRVRRAVQARTAELRAAVDSMKMLSGLSSLLGPTGEQERVQNLEQTQQVLAVLEQWLGGGPPHETTVIRTVARELGVEVHNRGADGDFIRDLMVRGWVVYSADAHGWTWQNGLKGEIQEPREFAPGRFQANWRPDGGRFLADALTVSNLTQTAFDYWRIRASQTDEEWGAQMANNQWPA